MNNFDIKLNRNGEVYNLNLSNGDVIYLNYVCNEKNVDKVNYKIQTKDGNVTGPYVNDLPFDLNYDKYYIHIS